MLRWWLLVIPGLSFGLGCPDWAAARDTSLRHHLPQRQQAMQVSVKIPNMIKSGAHRFQRRQIGQKGDRESVNYRAKIPTVLQEHSSSSDQQSQAALKPPSPSHGLQKIFLRMTAKRDAKRDAKRLNLPHEVLLRNAKREVENMIALVQKSWTKYAQEVDESITKVTDNVFFGGDPSSASMQRNLEALGIGYVVNFMDESSGPERMYLEKHMEQLWLPTRKGSIASPSTLFLCAIYIDQILLREPNAKIYVHSSKGKDRAAAGVLTYLMVSRGYSHCQASRFLVDRRSVNPYLFQHESIRTVFLAIQNARSWVIRQRPLKEWSAMHSTDWTYTEGEDQLPENDCTLFAFRNSPRPYKDMSCTALLATWAKKNLLDPSQLYRHRPFPPPPPDPFSD